LTASGGFCNRRLSSYLRQNFTGRQILKENLRTLSTTGFWVQVDILVRQKRKKIDATGHIFWTQSQNAPKYAIVTGDLPSPVPHRRSLQSSPDSTAKFGNRFAVAGKGNLGGKERESISQSISLLNYFKGEQKGKREKGKGNPRRPLASALQPLNPGYAITNIRQSHSKDHTMRCRSLLLLDKEVRCDRDIIIASYNTILESIPRRLSSHLYSSSNMKNSRPFLLDSSRPKSVLLTTAAAPAAAACSIATPCFCYLKELLSVKNTRHTSIKQPYCRRVFQLH